MEVTEAGSPISATLQVQEVIKTENLAEVRLHATWPKLTSICSWQSHWGSPCMPQPPGCPFLNIFQYPLKKFSSAVRSYCAFHSFWATLRTGRVDTGRWPLADSPESRMVMSAIKLHRHSGISTTESQSWNQCPQNSSLSQETEVALVNSLPERFRMQLHEDDGR